MNSAAKAAERVASSPAGAPREWTAGIVQNPADKNYYGKRNDRMQAFGQKRELSAKQIDMLAQWLRGEVN